MANSATERVQAIKQRIAVYEKRRSEKLALLAMQREQYNKLVVQAAELGVAKVKDLPVMLAGEEAALDTLLDTLETQLVQAEGLVNGL